MKKIKKYINRILKVVKLDEMEILPGHLAFYFIFIIIPVVSFIGLIGNNIDINYNNYYFNKSIPNAVISLITKVNINYDINIYIFMILSLYLASRGTRAIILTSNTLFKIKDKDIIKIRIKSIIMVIILFMLINFIIIVPILGDIIIDFLTNNLKEILIINTIYHLLKYPISILLMFILIKTLYLMSPSMKIESKYMNNGAFFTTIMWLILSRIYSYYLNNFNNYNLYFGNMGSILILLVWVYLLSYIFVIGLAINSNNYLLSLKECNK